MAFTVVLPEKYQVPCTASPLRDKAFAKRNAPWACTVPAVLVLIGDIGCSGLRAEVTESNKAGIFQRQTRELNVWIPFAFHKHSTLSCAPRFIFQFSSGTRIYAHLPASQTLPRATWAGFIGQEARALAQNYLRNLSIVTTNLSWALVLKTCFFLLRRNIRQIMQSCLSQKRANSYNS